MLVAILADTHLRRGERRLPAPCLETMRGAELILHAGDISTLAALEELRAVGPPVQAVRGNVDEPRLRGLLPVCLELELEGVRVAMTHDAGPARGRLSRMRGRFPRAAAVIFGHSHMPLHETAEDGFQIFNPGSPTERRRAPAHTMGLATVSAGQVSFTHLAL